MWITPTPGAKFRRCILLITMLFGMARPIRAYVAIDLYTPTGPDATWQVPYVKTVGVDGVAVGSSMITNFNMPQVPLLWMGSNPPVQLAPLFAGTSEVLASSGGEQVGDVESKAVLWHNSLGSQMSLHPTQLGVSTSVAYGTGGGEQVGVAGSHAVLWRGTAQSAVDLHPVANMPIIMTSSAALATDGVKQVGSGTGLGGQHALMWTGTALSAVDLEPTNLSGITGSSAFGLGGGEEVGFGNASGGGVHAMLWRGTADSAVDLHPTALFGSDLINSTAFATNGLSQAGYAVAGGAFHAVAWSGSADSAVDLAALLPPEFQSSQARAVDGAGNIFGFAADSSGITHVIEWVVPEPSAALGVFVFACGSLLGRRDTYRKRRLKRGDQLPGPLPLNTGRYRFGI
jgi:hypothetical protein